MNGEISDKVIEETQDTYKRDIWFCYTGMGAQWPGMGLTLYSESHTFRDAIDQCHKILSEEVGFDLLGTLSARDFSNVLQSMVCNVCIQIALTDLFTVEFKIKPDAVFGHSTGETVCGYALNCQTMRETVLAAYWRAKVLFDAQHNKTMKEGNSILDVKNLFINSPLCTFPACFGEVQQKILFTLKKLLYY